MSQPSDPRIEAVDTGPDGSLTLLACTACGVIVWDFDKHYAHAHWTQELGEL